MQLYAHKTMPTTVLTHAEFRFTLIYLLIIHYRRPESNLYAPQRDLLE